MVEPTPAIKILITDRIAQEGIDLLRTQLPEAQIDERPGLKPEQLRAVIGDYVRWRTREIGLKLLADHEYASNTVTAILMPESINVKALLKKLREEDGVVFASGQEHLEGKIIRVGHLGFFQEIDLVEAMDTLEKRLPEFGFNS